MAETREDVIRRLCDSWVAAAKKPDGGFAIGGATEKFRLHRNGINFHELNYTEILSACAGLSRVLLFKGLNTVIDLDHQLFWSWAGELLLSPHSSFFSRDEMEIQKLFEGCIRAALAGAQPPSQKKEDWEKQRQLSELVEFNTRQLVLHAHLVLAYLSFPLLEAIIKKACSAYVDYAGNVLAPFDAPRPRGNVKSYVSTDPRNGKCSSLRDLLHLLYENVADADLKRYLDEVRDHFHTLDNTDEPFDLIYSWRNASLHGQTGFPTIGGTVMNLSILIAFNQIRTQYKKLRDTIWENVQRDTQMYHFTGHRSPWSYYPPF